MKTSTKVMNEIDELEQITRRHNEQRERSQNDRDHDEAFDYLEKRDAELSHLDFIAYRIYILRQQNIGPSNVMRDLGAWLSLSITDRNHYRQQARDVYAEWVKSEQPVRK